MSLATYRHKRRFERTPEPAGKVHRGRHGLSFVVQKHHARRLHYDFRLEAGGVLKSWAVPKGPSLNPNDKRLAVMVEDHPIEYGAFEGTIPEGSYGAGQVIVWDRGMYEPVDSAGQPISERDFLRDLESGHLRFVLRGKKLRGGFSLIKIRRGKGNEWLLIKRADEFADDADVLEQDRSVISGRSIDGSSNGKTAPAKVKPSRPATHKAKMPRGIKPMLATLVEKPFDRPGWLYEIKWDGFRAIAEVESRKVHLYSRNFISFERRFPSLVRSLAAIGRDVVLDGEIVALDAKGKPQFQLLQNYQKNREGALVYYVFDLLYLDGRDLRSLPLVERKELLASVIDGKNDIRVSEHVVEQGVAFFEAASRQGLEGIIAKDGSSAYREGKRGWEWLKIKTRQRQEAVIGGFTEPRGSRKAFGALVLGVYDGDDLVYVGHAGGGFDARSLAAVHGKLEPLIQPACPFNVKPKTNTPVTWVNPQLVCEVAFQEWTGDGVMRQPVFLGVREDKKATEVTREVPKELPARLKKRAKAATAKRNTRRRNVVTTQSPEPADSKLPQGNYTNLDKVYWPKEGFTKGDLLRYYHDIAPVVLPHLRDRPFVLHRHPDGIEGKSFFQKDVSRTRPPSFIQTIPIRSEKDDKELRYILCQDEATLLYIANLGCIELNPWTSRVQHLDNPDYAIIDLDPQEVPFRRVIETAQEVHKLLDSSGVECFCKTSGKRGLHVFIPVGARYTNDVVRQFAQTVCTLVHARLPETTSMVRDPAQRRDRVYLDFLQNGIGKTTAVAYSVRPVPGACVSTPLRWAEVSSKLDPSKFTIETMRKRLDKVGDLWLPTLAKGADLSQAASRLGR